MSKMQEALDAWRNKSPNQRYGTMNTIAFEAGYQAAIAAVKEGGPVAFKWTNEQGKERVTLGPGFAVDVKRLYELPEDTP